MKKHLPYLLAFLLLVRCTETPNFPKNIYHYTEPKYHLAGIMLSSDTIHFGLDTNTFKRISSIHPFVQNGIEYLSFYDIRSKSINIYEFETSRLIKKISLENLFKKGKLFQTSVFVANFDTIIIANDLNIHLFDSAGQLHKSIPFLETQRHVKSQFDNTTSPILIGSKLYTGVRRHVNETSINELRSWKLIYEYDLNKNNAILKYHLPEMYQMDFYGRHYLYTSFCYNNGRFVFSFAADTNIYETDLESYNAAYFGKSRYHETPIKPVTKKNLDDELGFKFLRTQGSYDVIYFDPFKRRYLRVYDHKVSNEDFEAKSNNLQQSIIIFDEQFNIIGESNIGRGIGIRQLFFTQKGRIFVRVMNQDENVLHFVELKYNEPGVTAPSLTKN